MRYKELIETPYLQQLLKQIGNQQKVGAPVPPNKIPKGNVKSGNIKGQINQLNKQIDRQLLKPGKKIPLPINPNQEKDFEIDKVDNTTVTLKDPKPKPGQPELTTLKKSELNPVVTNLLRRQKAFTTPQ